MTKSIENLLREAVAALPLHDKTARFKLYESAHELLASKADSYPPQQFLSTKNRLLAVIREIEDEIEAIEKLVPSVALEPLDPPEQSSKVGDALSTLARYIPAGSGDLKRPGILAASAAVLICMSLIAVFLFNSGDNSATSTAKDRSTGTAAETGSENGASSVLFSTDFKNGLEAFAPISKSATGTVVVDKEAEILRATGQVTLFSKDHIPISRDKSYFMRVIFRTTDKKPTLNLGFYAGFATYNGEKKLETERPTHRYFVINGTIPEGLSPDKDGWYWFGGVITGSAKSHDAFRPTSEFAKPVLIFNFQRPEATTEIKRIEVIDLSKI